MKEKVKIVPFIEVKTKGQNINMMLNIVLDNERKKQRNKENLVLLYLNGKKDKTWKDKRWFEEEQTTTTL